LSQRQLESFSWLDAGEGSGDRHEIMFTWHAQAADSEARLLSAIDEPLYFAVKFLIWLCGLGF